MLWLVIGVSGAGTTGTGVAYHGREAVPIGSIDGTGGGASYQQQQQHQQWGDRLLEPAQVQQHMHPTGGPPAEDTPSLWPPVGTGGPPAEDTSLWPPVGTLLDELTSVLLTIPKR